MLGSCPQKTQLESSSKLSAMQFAPCPRTVVFAKEFIYALSKGDKPLENGLRSRHGKYVQLHNLLGSPRPVNELRTISASMYNVIAISCKKTWKILCIQVLHKCVDSYASFLHQNGLNSQLAIGLGGYSTKQLE